MYPRWSGLSSVGERPRAALAPSSNPPWPREFTDGDSEFTVYQPQIEEWDEPRVRARAAVSIERPASPLQHFGVIWFSARAEIDKTSRLVALDDFTIDRVSFPGEPDRAPAYQGILQRHLPQSAQTLSLDRLQASLAITQAQSAALKPQPVKNDPATHHRERRSSAPGARGRQARAPASRGLEPSRAWSTPGR